MGAKVLVGCPTYDRFEYCLDEYAEVIKNLSYPDYDVLLVDDSKTDEYCQRIKSKGIPAVRIKYDEEPKKPIMRIVAGRDRLKAEVLNKGYDYLLFIDQDVIPPKDIIEKLLRHNKKMISGIYYKTATMVYRDKKGAVVKKKEAPLPMIFGYLSGVKDKMRTISAEDVKESRLMKIRSCGTGCLLIHRDVLEKVNFRWLEETGASEDTCFCTDALNAGFEIFADTSVKCKHLDDS
jgi:GT2 family glycosyltransferase|tara:strand:+ start:1126 stop:1830 length:705 start_codon:yes stop_codon:yes gene_type:complete